jgi:hypothetical protein
MFQSYRELRDDRDFICHPEHGMVRGYPRLSSICFARQYFTGLSSDANVASLTTTPTTTQTALLTQAQANLYLPLPVGANAPSVGQAFRFVLGGIITTPATGTLVITPFHGSNTTTATFGTSMGASPAQTVAASLTNIPWRIEGEIVYRSISAAASSSTAWLTGNFWSQGTLATAGGGWTIPFGSTAAVTVDTTGTVTTTSGNLNFSVTFSVTGGVVTVAYTGMQSLN